jgi:hypothetical protein
LARFQARGVSASRRTAGSRTRKEDQRNRLFTTGVWRIGRQAGRAGERLSHSLRHGVRRAWAQYWKRRAERAVCQLCALDEATLAAIGVGRSEIGLLVYRAAALARGIGRHSRNGRCAAGMPTRPLCCEALPWA